MSERDERRGPGGPGGPGIQMGGAKDMKRRSAHLQAIAENIGR